MFLRPLLRSRKGYLGFMPLFCHVSNVLERERRVRQAITR
jgi:hypothetical protein